MFVEDGGGRGANEADGLDRRGVRGAGGVGVFIPVSQLPAWLRDIGRLFPLAHLANGLQSAFIDPHSTGLSLEDVGVLVIWGVVAAVVAVRTFRWEPQGR